MIKRNHRFNRFQLNHYITVDKQVQLKRRGKKLAFIVNRNKGLSLDIKSRRPKLSTMQAW
jgi:hypothetical protein